MIPQIAALLDELATGNELILQLHTCLTFPGAAKMLGVSPATVYELVKRGRLPVVYISETIRRIRVCDLIEYVERTSREVVDRPLELPVRAKTAKDFLRELQEEFRG